MNAVKIIFSNLADANSRLWRRNKIFWLFGWLVLLCVCCAGFGSLLPISPARQNPIATIDSAAVSTETTARQYATLTADAFASPTAQPTRNALVNLATATRVAATSTRPPTQFPTDIPTNVPLELYGVATISLIVREGPGTTYKQIATLLKGERVKLIALSPDKYWVQHSRGWSERKYLQINGDAEQLGIAQNIPVAAPAQAITRSPTKVPTVGVAQAPPTPKPVQAVSTGHQYVASSRAKKYYYCDNDPQWRSLSPKYLVWSSDPSRFIRQGLILHRPC